MYHNEKAIGEIGPEGSKGAEGPKGVPISVKEWNEIAEDIERCRPEPFVESSYRKFLLLSLFFGSLGALLILSRILLR